MRAGLLTEPIEIYEKVLQNNQYGEQTEEWVLKYSTKARLVHDGGSRVIQNDEVFFAHTKTFQVRYYVPVEDYDKIKWDGKYYRILNIEPDKMMMNKTIKTELIDD
jgi:SPP1 family predicted phage head-tail adaptor